MGGRRNARLNMTPLHHRRRQCDPIAESQDGEQHKRRRGQRQRRRQHHPARPQIPNPIRPRLPCCRLLAKIPQTYIRWPIRRPESSHIDFYFEKKTEIANQLALNRAEFDRFPQSNRRRSIIRVQLTDVPYEIRISYNCRMSSFLHAEERLGISSLWVGDDSKVSLSILLHPHANVQNMH